GLYYYGYRYYAPELGRWINRDPLGEQGGVNLYSFVLNNPINQSDYLGMNPITSLIKDCALDIIEFGLKKALGSFIDEQRTCNTIRYQISNEPIDTCGEKEVDIVTSVSTDAKIWEAILKCVLKKSSNIFKWFDVPDFIKKKYEPYKHQVKVINSEYKARWGCISKNCAEFDMLLSLSIKIFDETKDLQEKKLFLGSCTDAYRDSPIVKHCCKCYK
ncbi:MAG: hypothetical protein KAH06_07385, partial [Desulfobacterales bacterium]|nr:hypothetical protein [Desulfobacterales bacterium]